MLPIGRQPDPSGNALNMRTYTHIHISDNVANRATTTSVRQCCQHDNTVRSSDNAVNMIIQSDSSGTAVNMAIKPDPSSNAVNMIIQSDPSDNAVNMIIQSDSSGTAVNMRTYTRI